MRNTNTRKLKAKLAELGLLIKDLAQLTGIPKATLYRKLYHAPDTVTLREMKAVQKALSLTSEECWAIFICPECTEIGT